MLPHSNLIIVSALVMALSLGGSSPRGEFRVWSRLSSPSPEDVSGSPSVRETPGKDSVHIALSTLAPKELGLFARVLRNGVNVEADTTFTGKITSDSLNTLRFEASGGAVYTVGFTLPRGKGFQLRKAVNTKGRLTVNARLSPDSSRQTVIVVEGSRLLAGFTWQRSQKPVSLDLVPGVSLVQEVTGNVSVSLVTSAGRTRVIPGKVVKVNAGSHTFTVFVHTSMYQHVPATFPGGDTPPGYILRALVLSD